MPSTRAVSGQDIAVSLLPCLSSTRNAFPRVAQRHRVATNRYAVTANMAVTSPFRSPRLWRLCRSGVRASGRACWLLSFKARALATCSDRAPAAGPLPP